MGKTIIRKLRPASFVFAFLVFAWAAPKGTAPRSSAANYPAHAQQDGIGIGARLLSAAEVRKTFVSDVNLCCVVVELAVFPEADNPFSISRDDIALRLAGSETSAKASGPADIATTLQQEAEQEREVKAQGETGVGVKGGTVYDRNMNRVHQRGIGTHANVEGEVGPSGGHPDPDDKNRSATETELREKALPEGDVSKPVAGYVFFQLSPKKHAKYQLLYTVGEKQISLPLQ